jgi:diguanylate cyclase/phosphodiesterase
MEGKKNKRTKSILRKTLIPIVLVIVFQTVFFFCALFASDTFTNLRNNSFEMFNGKVINVSDSLTNNMIRVWSNISETENDVVSRVETILQEQGKSYEDIAKPFTEEEKATEGPRTYHINEIILSEIADDILYMLRKNLVTDAFIVLDGPGTRNQPQDYYKGGICLRDMDPTSASSDNADIEMTYGSIEIRDQLHVTGNKTYSTFEFSEECSNDNEAFFFKPLNAAKEAKKVSDTKNYAYWSPSYKMNQYGETIVSYSIPLISSKGDVFGVLGIGLSVAYLSGQVNIGNTSGEYGAAVCLVKNNEDGSVDLERIVHSGSLGQSVFGSVSSVSALPDGYTNFYKIPSSKVVCNVKTLDIYNRNGPFSGDVWAVVGMVDEGVLMTFYNTILIAMSASALAAVALALVAVTLVVRSISKPIAELAEDTQNYSAANEQPLRKTYIKEIDLLAEAFLEKSETAENIAQKVSGIISNSRTQIGVFEYVYGEKKVFVSRNVYTLMRWQDERINDYIGIDRFRRLMSKIDPLNERDETVTYKIPEEEAWIQISVVDDGKKIIGTITDITLDVIEKRRIEFERDFDVLTGLNNRRYYNDKLYELCETPELVRIGAMVMIDLDELKYVNDTYGHSYGDKYIQLMGELIKGFPRSNALIARLSGDEFAVFLYGYASEAELLAEVQGVWSRMELCFLPLPSGENFKLRASGGYALYPRNAATPEELFRYSDYAMYSVKHTDKGRLGDFDIEDYRKNEFIMSGQEEFFHIVESRKVRYAFQMIVDARTGETYGYEALMRPQGETIKSPVQILEIAKKCAKLNVIEQLTWNGALETYQTRLGEGLLDKKARLFINSISDCIIPPDDIRALETAYGELLGNVVLEIMENEPISSSSTLEKKISYLGRWNAELAIDDFGSAYNTDAVLLITQPQYIKFERAIIQGIDASSDKMLMVENMVNYMHRRNIRVIAEGVETFGEMKKVIELGVDYIQGYYLHKPSFTEFGLSDEKKKEILLCNGK